MIKGNLGKILATSILMGMIICSSLVFSLNSNSVADNTELDELEIISPETSSMSVSVKWMQSHNYGFDDFRFMDYNYDGFLDVVASYSNMFLTTQPEGIMCFNGIDGSENWRRQFAFVGEEESICICDIDKDNQQEIFVCSIDLYCFDEKGVLDWSYTAGSNIRSFSIVDIDGDDNLDIIINAEDELTILNYLGVVRKSIQIESSTRSSLAIGNLDMTGALEIIVPRSTDLTWYNCYDPNLNLLWTKQLVFDYYEEYDIRHPILADIDPSHGLEIIGNEDGILCLDSNGELLWRDRDNSFNYYAPIIADINNDGLCEIIISGFRELACLDLSGGFLWQYDFDGYSDLQSVVADLDGDGKSEFLVSRRQSVSPNVYFSDLICLNHLGELLWTFSDNIRRISGISTMDLDFDGKLEVIFIGEMVDNYVGAPSNIYCLEIDDIQKSGNCFWHNSNGLKFDTGNIDSDGDFIDDLSEKYYDTSRHNNDSDADGIFDGLELIEGLNPSVHDSTNDEDSDGLSNIEELSIYHSSIYNADSDGDGVSDYDEAITYQTDPLKVDTDGDELSDFDEIFIHTTDPNNPDSDTDLAPDGWEIQYGYNPLLNDSYVDDDNDTLLAFEEYLAGSSPFSNDTDSDGLSDPDEYFIHGTNAGNDNTDGDLMGDFWEVTYGTNPLVDDSLGDPDVDFLVNFEECNLGTDPLNRDTDGDGFIDGDEVMKGYDPLDPNNHPAIPPTPSVKLGVSLFTGIVCAFLTLSLFIGVLTKKKLKE